MRSVTEWCCRVLREWCVEYEGVVCGGVRSGV